MNTHSTTSNEGWQDIATAPNCEVILYFPPVDHPMRGRTQGHWVTVARPNAFPRKASHWMPLPAPPVQP